MALFISRGAVGFGKWVDYKVEGRNISRGAFGWGKADERERE